MNNVEIIYQQWRDRVISDENAFQSLYGLIGLAAVDLFVRWFRDLPDGYHRAMAMAYHCLHL